MDNLILVMFAAILFVGILLMVIITLTRKAPGGLNRDEFRTRWMQIERSLSVSDEGINHLAILNADKLLDQALKARGFRGETMGERLKTASSQLSNRNAVWTAHKLRNRIAHESDVKLSPNATRQALKAFKSGLRDLGAV
ncbi:hypothetical protein TM7_0555 [candidate division TM7 genomosp. GTL1]|nr:hypothetical protein TM7_0555 [candidate division TM7 genomosp. GTL1]